MEIKVGSLVRSKRGHDLDRIYLVIKIEGEFSYCVDGKYRPLNNPKKKRLKHLSLLHNATTFAEEKLKNNVLHDFEISTFIKNECIMHKD